MDKKKTKTAKHASVNSVEPKKPAAQMVVEVEEEAISVSNSTIEKIEKDTAAVDAATQKLEDDIEKELAKEENQVSTPSPPEIQIQTNEKTQSEEKKPKEVVKEFFRSNSGVAPEIDSYRGKSGTKSLFVWVVVVLVVAGLTGGGLMILSSGKQVKLTTLFVKPTPTPTPTSGPTPTPTPSVNRSDFKLQILNGSGVAGAGSKMKEYLESKGYTVESTGNADSFDHEKTEIEVKPDKEGFLSLLQNDLKDTYSLGTAAATLSSDSSFDARVTVGKQ